MTLRHSLDSTFWNLWKVLWALRSGADYLGQVLSHPSLRDGIMDDRTNVVAVLDKVVERRPELLDVLLDPGQTIVKGRSITLLLAGILEMPWPGESLSFPIIGGHGGSASNWPALWTGTTPGCSNSLLGTHGKLYNIVLTDARESCIWLQCKEDTCEGAE